MSILAGGYVPVIVVPINPYGYHLPLWSLWFFGPLLIFCLVALVVIGREIWKNR